MVVWINGAFGAGKTTVASRLCAGGNGLLIDPEEVGALLRRVLPEGEQQPDFQDHPTWRTTVVSLLCGLDAELDRPLVVPMTVVDEDYFDETVGALRRAGVEVHHFTLVASPEVLRKRLRWRLWAARWPMAQIDRCVSALRSDLFAVHVETDERSAEAVAKDIWSRVPGLD